MPDFPVSQNTAKDLEARKQALTARHDALRADFTAQVEKMKEQG